MKYKIKEYRIKCCPKKLKINDKEGIVNFVNDVDTKSIKEEFASISPKNVKINNTHDRKEIERVSVKNQLR